MGIPPDPTGGRPPVWNWWKWTLIAAAIVIATAAVGGAVGWATSGPALAGEIIGWVCGLGLPLALVIEAVAAKKSRRDG